MKARKKEEQIAKLIHQDSVPQRIGILAQKGVYEFHQNIELLDRSDGVQKISELIELSKEVDTVQEKVSLILTSYYTHPLLLEKEITQLNSGDEGYPDAILIQQGNYQFKLFAAMDCVLTEPDETIHIVDFKTGESKFDKRQIYIYLLAAQYLYPEKKAIASFYNLQTGDWSTPISATEESLQSIQIELARISKKYQQELQQYKKNPQDFDRLFPPNPNFSCRYCPFNSICQYSFSEDSISS